MKKLYSVILVIPELLFQYLFCTDGERRMVPPVSSTVWMGPLQLFVILSPRLTQGDYCALILLEEVHKVTSFCARCPWGSRVRMQCFGVVRFIWQQASLICSFLKNATLDDFLSGSVDNQPSWPRRLWETSPSWPWMCDVTSMNGPRNIKNEEQGEHPWWLRADKDIYIRIFKKSLFSVHCVCGEVVHIWSFFIFFFFHLLMSYLMLTRISEGKTWSQLLMSLFQGESLFAREHSSGHRPNHKENSSVTHTIRSPPRRSTSTRRVKEKIFSAR